LIDNKKRSAIVIARQDSIFLVIKKEDFIKLGNSHPQICLPITHEISKIISSRLCKTTEDILTIFDALVNEINS
jgi:CRP/FNR family cyclic AMP-dependent transcriptional regulator